LIGATSAPADDGYPLTIRSEAQTFEARAHEIRLAIMFAVVLWERDGALVYWADDGITGEISGPLSVEADTPDEDHWRTFADALNERNRRLGLPCPWELPEPKRALTSLKAPDYVIQTSQEWDAVERATSAGHTREQWESNPQALARVHHSPDLSFHVRLELTEQEKADGIGIDALERLTDKLNADGVFALLYVSRVLAPPAPLPPNAYAGGWIDLDDVASKIWPAPRSSKERLNRREAVYEVLRFGARARVIGKRRGTYHDKDTGEEIPTEIDGPMWQFMDRERPIGVDPSLFPSWDVPLRLELVCSKDWTHITTSAATAQYLPLGEVLGAIPPDKPSGAWARVLGLALANFWRRNPRQALDGSLRPTRRELLTHYAPKIADPLQVLRGSDPQRALMYWRGALAILCDQGFLAKEGEGALSLADMKAARPRYEWQDPWLDEHVDLRPGPDMRPAVQASADALPLYKPRALAPKRKPGRPRKAKP